MTDLNDTEKKLATIWKRVLFLSEEELQNLNSESEFLDLIEGFCSTLEIAILQRLICTEFGVSSNIIGELEPDTTLREQAAWIDRYLNSSKSETMTT